MKLEQAHIDQIRTAFEKMQSKKDLLDLLNEAKSFVYGEKAVPFELKQLTWYANPNLAKKRYSEFKIKKKSGNHRYIHAPVKGLKSLQKVLSFVLHCVYEPHNAAMGFVRDRSIVDNAKLHVGSRYVYNIDLKDFFPSIDQARVWKCLQLRPFNLNDKDYLRHSPHSLTPQYGVIQLIRHYAGPWNRSEEILYYEYDGYAFRNGRKKLLLKSGESIIYEVSCVQGETSGTIEIYLERSSFESVKKFIQENTPASNLSDVLFRLIELHQKKILAQDKRKKLADLIASLCCTEMEVERKSKNGEWEKVRLNVLPQGAPTSPVITNIVCQKLDFLLTGVAKRFGLKYSRYADDITFSSMHNVYQPGSEFLNELYRIIEEQNFHIKESKTRLQKDGYRKEVTGLLVNEKVNVQQRYIKQLRMWIYYWERYGYERASAYFLQQYIADKGHVKNGKPDFANVISGKLDYLKMVRGSDNELYLKLKSRFDMLILAFQKYEYIQKSNIPSKIDNNQVRITLEVYQSPKMNEKLYNSINIPKETVLPSTIIVPNSIIEFEDSLEENRNNNLFPHNPIYTISFLKKFKIGDGSGFKELVHDVILSDESVQDILNKVKSHPNFIYYFKKEWISNVSYLNRAIQKEVIKLIDLFENEGVPFYYNCQKHPFNNDSNYTTYAKKFKKKYRYGSGSEYSKLQNDLINIFNDLNVPLNSLLFMPDERKFNIRSSFFTWQPAIYNGIRYIVQGIRDHTNINGLSTFNLNNKKILIEVEKIHDGNISIVELRIFDQMSISKIDSLTLLQFFQGTSAFKFDFRNLCDWIVECDFLDESSKRLNLLNAPISSDTIQVIENLPYSVGGFKHILKFYDIK